MPETPLITTRLNWALLAALVVVATFAATNFEWPLLLQRVRTMTDFDLFFVSGRLFWEGRLTDAYHFRTLLAAQNQFHETRSFMPWTYPPPFDFVTAVIGLMPIGIAYLLFTGTSALAYFAVVRQLAGPHTGAVLLAIFPALLVNVRTGQNGFLTGALLGCYFVSYLRRGWRGGFALGCMVIKPHLAVAAAILVLVARDWRSAAAALATGAGLLAASGLAFGWPVFHAFADSVREASVFLAAGYYYMFRMVSLYATLNTSGVPATVALGCQASLAFAACGATILAACLLRDKRLVVSVAAFACLSVSPYCYNYDLTLLGLAAAAVAPVLAQCVPRRRLLALFPVTWLACGWGMIVSLTAHDAQAGEAATLPSGYPSMAWPALMLACYMVCARLRSSKAGGSEAVKP